MTVHGRGRRCRNCKTQNATFPVALPNVPIRHVPAIVKMKVAMTVAVKNNNKAPLVVPPAVRREARFKSGQELEFRASGGVITIVPKLPKADDEYTPEQRAVMDAQLAEGLADLKAGRVHGPFSTHEEFIASLHKEARKLSRKKSKRST